MPDFADLLGIEPATPSPLKHIRGDSPTIPPSDQLFSKYLASPDNRDKDPSAYSPSDKPFLHLDPELPVLVTSAVWQQYHSKGGTLLPAGWNHNVVSRYLDQGRYKRRVRNFFLGF
jgi:hypothetical protein